MPKMTQLDWKHKENRNTLTCAKCQRELDISMFTPHGTTSAGTQKYRSMCKPCYNVHASENYESVKKTNTYRQMLVEHVNNAKTECVVCGYDRCKQALDFHHVDPANKDSEISDMIGYSQYRNTTIPMLDVEIAKCVVICCRCHRELHDGVIELECVEERDLTETQ